ncbi:RluA family pseudouridine synthase [uncultured Litoreibacter sp.]|uniref:RluA family pseudouridine synthase n=1 Tax=uncultured Litoreibacter sp. TaxID=1392394 RepID=UPI0026381A94|nr:RluA family pseudouridine synthase [uncultured Litoreibacter sp.]
MSPQTIAVEITDAPPARLDKALALFAPVEAQLSRSRLVKLIEQGAVSLDGVVVDQPKTKAQLGQVWMITIGEAVEYDTVAEDIPLDVIYEDDALIVVNKPAGMVVHPAPGSPKGTLVNALLHHCVDSLSGIGGEKRPGIVHRIDKETSGLLVVAKTDIAHQGLAKQFEKHTVERRYNALVYGVPEASDPRINGLPGVAFEQGNILRIIANLARHKTDRQRQAVVKNVGRHAVTRARVLQRFGTPAVVGLLECWLETGRTHQIRVHMAHVGHSLVGDPVYGGRRKLAKNALPEAAQDAIREFPRQALHAATLGFKHPVSGEMMRFEAPLPPDFTALLEELG